VGAIETQPIVLPASVPDRAVIDVVLFGEPGGFETDEAVGRLVLDGARGRVRTQPTLRSLGHHNSDRGSQYAAKDYRAALEAAGITCSMSRRGNCWDNAVAESFFATLKTELVHDVIFTSREAAKTTIAEWIEIFYNGKRRHSSLDYHSPLEFERRYYENLERTEVA
jgi:transposase InsO family protein